MVKTYILAPDYSTPPPPSGPVRLGDILADLTELVALNPENRIHIPESTMLPTDVKRGFKATRSSLLSGNLGVWAKICGMFGIGVSANVGWAFETSNDDVMSFESIETLAFNPTHAYIKEAMNAGPVKEFMEASSHRIPVYMITGLKVGKGASLETSKSREHSLKLKLALSSPITEIQAGPEVGFNKKTQGSVSFIGSSDFIIAFRVRRISYRNGVLQTSAHNVGATMLDGKEETMDGVSKLLEYEEDAQVDDMGLDSALRFQTIQEIDTDEEISWIVPNIHQA
ncbi:hypothetical protein ABKA04_004808 [Annulohypoxylon sp. FPYF3050]